MGRRRTVNHDLPPGMHRKPGRDGFYYGRRDIALGKDYQAALRKWAELRGETVATTQPTFADAVTAFRLHGLAGRAPKTQREYERQLHGLGRVFGHMPLATITPAHVASFMAARSEKADGRGGAIVATREKALLSVVFNFARARGMTTAPNPCAGIRGKGSKRTVYVTHTELAQVLKHADRPTRDFLELAYRTGADASIVLRLTRADVRDGAIHGQRSKTGERARVSVVGPLRALLKRIARNKPASVFLIADEHGQPMTLTGIRKRFWKARTAAGAHWAIRDLRAKAASDLPSTKAARDLLAHADEGTTAVYRRRRIGELATPPMARIADTTTELRTKRRKD